MNSKPQDEIKITVPAQMPAEGFGERWAADMRSAWAMFLEAGVSFEYVEARQ